MESQDANGVVNKSFMMLFAFLQERMIHMVLSNAYNYINVLDKAADASWVRNDVLANNIANADTPNYKRKDVQRHICPMQWQVRIRWMRRWQTLIFPHWNQRLIQSRQGLVTGKMATMLTSVQRMSNWLKTS